MASNSVWLNEYHHLDNTPVDDVAYSFYLSFARLTLAKLQYASNSCDFALSRVLESTVYKYDNMIKGHILTFEIVSHQSGLMRTVEALLEPVPVYQSFMHADPVSRLQSVKVGWSKLTLILITADFNLIKADSDLIKADYDLINS